MGFRIFSEESSLMRMWNTVAVDGGLPRGEYHAPSYIALSRLRWTLQFITQIAPYFSNTQGLSDAQAGGRIAPSSIGNALGNLIAGQIIKKCVFNSPPDRLLFSC